MQHPVATVRSLLHIAASDRIGPLVDHLAEVLAEPPDDPFAPEWVAVPSVGMRRWLSLELAQRLGSQDGRSDGVAANIAMPFPGKLRSAVLAAARGSDDPDPWEIDRLVWTILDVADQHRDDPAFDAITRPRNGVPRFSVARKVADLFDQYHVHRPQMVQAWQRGEPLDGQLNEIEDRHRWQYALWKKCRDQIGVPSPPEVLPGALAQLAADELDVDLPRRLAFFGLTQLPGGQHFLELASALAAHRDVHLLLLEPSSTVRATLAKRPPGATDTAMTRAGDTSAEAVENPLLRSWGRQHREAAQLIDSAVRSGSVASPQELAGPQDAAPDTLLGQIQADIRADRSPSGAFPWHDDDRSVQLHACYGPARQAEVARDAILHLLADEALGLTEDDVVVLCPKLEEMAPLVEAAFGPSADAVVATDTETPAVLRPPALRYRIADRSLGTVNPMLSALTALLDLLASRVEASALIDLIATAPVRQRYRFDDDDVSRIAAWAKATNVRWGIDAAHRVAFGLPETVTSNSWRAGLDRILLGAAVHDDGSGLALGSVSAFAPGADDLDLAGRLAQLLATLADAEEWSRAVHTPEAWITWLERLCAGMLDHEPGAPWQATQVTAMLQHLADAAAGTSEVDLSFADVRRAVAASTVAEGGRPDFFRGGVTVTSMVPLRGIPHRVVCLLGLDEGALPQSPLDGDDLLAAGALIGDRDRRADGRQGLLDAVLAARDHLIVVRTGRDVRTNAPTPPSVVVAELMDAMSTTAAGPVEVGPALEKDHPRQDFAASNFQAATPDAAPWSFDPEALAAANARTRRSRDRISPFLAGPLDDTAGDEIALDDLLAFFDHPVKAFLTRRMGLAFPSDDGALSPVLPVAPNSLEEWGIADRLLTDLAAGRTVEAWRASERAKGSVAPGALGDGVLDEAVHLVQSIWTKAERLGMADGPGESVPIDITLPDGNRVVGVVPVNLADDNPDRKSVV